MSAFALSPIDAGYAQRAREQGDHALVVGRNYGQGSSREHAALAPRYLGLRLALAQSFARIHWQNLINFGVLPLTFTDETVLERLSPDDVLVVDHPAEQLRAGKTVTIENQSRRESVQTRYDLSPRQIEIFEAGGIINWAKSPVSQLKEKRNARPFSTSSRGA